MKVWDQVHVKQMRNAHKSCPVLGKLCLQMVQKLHQKEIRELLQINEFRQLLRIKTTIGHERSNHILEKTERERSKWEVVQRKEIIRGVHDEWGYQGVARTMVLVKNFAWPGLQEDVKRYMAGCKTCAMTKGNGPSAKTKLETIKADKP